MCVYIYIYARPPARSISRPTNSFPFISLPGIGRGRLRTGVREQRGNRRRILRRRSGTGSTAMALAIYIYVCIHIDIDRHIGVCIDVYMRRVHAVAVGPV